LSDNHEPTLNERARELLAQISSLQDELRDTLTEQEARVRYTIEGKRIEFEHAVREAHRQLKLGFWRWLRLSRPRNILAAPFIYGMIFPLVFFDLSLSLYQAVCFRLFGIARVKRSDYMVVDHHKLAYLNIAEKFNCLYCEYGNGLVAYAREIVARTEQYWCPIKHAHKILDPHAHYSHFMEYGDAESFRQHWQVLRDDLAPDSHKRACEAGGCNKSCH
jgi:hypothetical protein